MADRAFDDLARIGPHRVWDGVAGRVVEGERITMAVVEIDPGAVVPEHAHENEQLGLVLSGSVRFRVGHETQELGPGSTWRIPSNVRHEVTAGADGAVVVDVFAPVRSDWAGLAVDEPRPPRWPAP